MDDNLVLRALMGAAGASVLAEIDLEKKRQEVEDLRKDRDHWKQARDTAIEGGELLLKSNQTLQAEIETLKGAMAADDKRLRDAEERIWPERTLGCDAPDAMADEILHLRQQLAEQQAETFDVRRQRNNETDRLNATNAVSVQQRDEIAYLRARLDEERSVIAGLRQQLRTAAGRVDLTEENNRSLREQLDAAQAAVTLQRAGIDRLQAFVNLSRRFLGDTVRYADVDRLRAALAELDAGTELTLVAARCPECDGSGMVDSGGFGPDGKAISVPCGGDCSGKPCPSQPAPVAEPLDAEGGA